jgi:hypothetical protein
MSYIYANNDYVYNTYENKLNTILNSNKLDFLSNTNNIGIFDVDKSYGQKYCQQLSNEFPECSNFIYQHYTQFVNFMKLGEQEQFISNEFNLVMTANTARYIYHAYLISKYIESKFGTQKIDVVEIGGGYGGLCFWLQLLKPELINNYTIIDLPNANKLQQRCLSELNTKVNTISNPNDYKKSNVPLFVISNYGYSEFNGYYQHLYRDTILKLADSGFMIWNNWTGIFEFTSLPIKIEEERPVFTNCYNKFLYF